MTGSALSDKTHYPLCTLTKSTKPLVEGKGSCTVYELELHNRLVGEPGPVLAAKQAL